MTGCSARRARQARVDHSPVGVSGKSRTDNKTEPGNELIGHIVTPGASTASDWCCSLLVLVIGGLCGSTLRRTEPWTVSSYTERLLILLTLGLLWPRLESWRCSVTDRVLAFHLFGLCHVGRLRDGGRLGSRQFDHTVGGRNCSRDRLSRGCHQRRDVFGCAGNSHFAGVHSLGP